MLLVIAGFLAGFVHVLSGPDHLAAVALFSANGRNRAWRSGFFWAGGHSAAVCLLAAAAYVLHERLPLDVLRRWSEPLVGVVLIALGLIGLARAWKRWVRSAVRSEGPSAPQAHSVKSFVVGLIHGTAGGSHFLGVLPALVLPSRFAALEYVTAFSIGTVAAMIGFAMFIGRVAERAVSISPVSYWRMQAAFSTLSVTVGGFWIAFS